MTKSEGLRRPYLRKKWHENGNYNAELAMHSSNGHGLYAALPSAHTKTSTANRLVILATYVSVWSTFYLLVHYSQRNIEAGSTSSSIGDTTANFDPLRSVFSIICVELIKGCVSLGDLLYLHPSVRVFSIPSIMTSSCIRSLLKSYAPLAMLYALYNNLMFFNLSKNCPSAYLILSSSRLVLTSLIWHTLFRTRIQTRMKIALCFVTCGMLAKVALGAVLANRMGMEIMSQTLTSTNVLLILMQMMCSVLAGIYNETLRKSGIDFKNNDKTMSSFGLTHPQSNLHLQNIVLCLDSIGINLVIMMGLRIAMLPGKEFSGVESTLFSQPSIYTILTLAAAGIMTSTLLFYENSITKGLASAFEVMLTSIIEYAYFHRIFGMEEVLGLLMVFLGTIISVFPGTNVPSTNSSTRNLSENRKRSFTALSFIVIILSLLCFLAFDSKHFLKLHGVTTMFREVEEVCPKSISNSHRPEDIDELQYSRVLKCENVVRYIVSELDKKGAIVSIMYGTLLFEHRNGTGPCLQYNLRDKDFDIAVFEPHFFLVLDMAEDIQNNFDFKVGLREEDHLFINFLPLDQEMAAGFQVDVYGFRVNSPKNGLIYFPHDWVTVAADAFLPLVKHKTLAYSDHDVSSRLKPHYLYYYRPFNASCLLANMYGKDWRTPKKGHFIRRDAYDFPCQRSILSLGHQEELDKQLRLTTVMERKLINSDFGKSAIVL